MSQKSFLLITNIYPPAFAPRMGYMLKYLQPKGWQVQVITRYTDNDQSYQSLVQYVPEAIHLNVGKLGFTSRVNALIYNIFYPFFFYWEAWQIYHTALRLYKKNAYSFVFCCISEHIYMLQASVWLSKKLQIPLMVDFRDIEEQNPKYQRVVSFFKGLLETNKGSFIFNKRNKLLTKAISVTSVSPWHVETLKEYNTNTQVIYNGFDAAIFKPEEPINSDCFEIIYTGTILPKRHDVELFFDCLNQFLSADKAINLNKIKVSFYTPINCRKIITNHPLFSRFDSILTFYDFVDTKQVPYLLNKASVLLLLSNLFHKDGPKGLESTTKFFEYLAVRKPILCTRSDEASLEASIVKLNAGCAARTAKQGADFLLEKYKEWLDKGYTTQNSDYATIQSFSRQKQAEQFESIFLKLLND
jgi:glycosyltransferase involved in cell wall biosynthesis